jgi:drug/metabolite transporter (DMT)-like permease
MTLATNKTSTATGRKYTAELMLVLVTMFWGGTFVIVKESLSDISPMFFIALRFSIAVVLVLPFIFKYKHQFTKQAVWGGSLLGVLVFIGFATQTAGLQYTTATKSAFITSTSVVMVPLLQVLIEKRRPANGSIIGIVLVFVGILFLSSGGNSILTFLSDLGANFNLGDFLTLICAVSYAVYIVYLDVTSKANSFWPIFIMQMFVTAILSFIFAMIFNAAGIEHLKLIITKNLIFGLGYTAIITTLLTTAILIKYQKALPPAKAGIIYSLEPLFASIIAFFVLSEKISNFGLIGSVLIFLGLITSETFDLAVEKWQKK